MHILLNMAEYMYTVLFGYKMKDEDEPKKKCIIEFLCACECECFYGGTAAQLWFLLGVQLIIKLLRSNARQKFEIFVEEFYQNQNQKQYVKLEFLFVCLC